MSQEPKKIGRRTFLNYAIAVVATGVIVGAATYLAAPKGVETVTAPGATVTTTKTVTITGTPTTTTPTTTSTITTTPLSGVVRKAHGEAATYKKFDEYFESLYPGIDVQAVYMSAQERSQKIMADAMTQPQVPIFDVFENFNMTLVQLDYLYPLDTFTDYEEAIKNELIPDKSWHYIVPFPDGKHHTGGINMWPYITMFFYRQDLFEKVGIDRPPKTYDEYFEFAKMLTLDTDKDGKTDVYGSVWYLGYDKLVFSLTAMLHAMDARLVDDDLYPAFNNDAGTWAIEMMRKFYQAGVMDPASLTLERTGQIATVFASGKAAMNISNNVQYATMVNPEKAIPEVRQYGRWAICPGQVNPTGGWYGGTPVVMAKRAISPACAWEYIKHFTGPVMDKWMVIENSLLPKYEKVAEDPEVKKAIPWVDVAMQQKKMKGTYQYVGEMCYAADVLVKLTQEHLVPCITDPNKDIRSALNLVASEWKKEIDKIRGR